LANISRSYDGCSSGPLFIGTQCSVLLLQAKQFNKTWYLLTPFMSNIYCLKKPDRYN